jgi:hypothetical protein
MPNKATNLSPDNAPTNPSRRSFVALVAGGALVGCGKKPEPAPQGYGIPISDQFQFIRQKIVDGKPAMEKGEPVIDESVNHFSDLKSELAGKPYTVSFMTAMCTTPVEGREMLCDKMGKALAMIAKAEPETKHVVIAAWPQADYNGGTLWGNLLSRGLTTDNTIVLFPTHNGKPSGIAEDGLLVHSIQDSLRLYNDSDKNPTSHNSLISHYSDTGRLCGYQDWRTIMRESKTKQTCPVR